MLYSVSSKKKKKLCSFKNLTEGEWSLGHRDSPRRPFFLQNNHGPDTAPEPALPTRATSRHLPWASGPWHTAPTPPWTQTGEQRHTLRDEQLRGESGVEVLRSSFTTRQFPIHSDTRTSTFSGSSISSPRPWTTVTTSSQPFCFTSCLVYSAMELASTAYTCDDTDYHYCSINVEYHSTCRQQ